MGRARHKAESMFHQQAWVRERHDNTPRLQRCHHHHHHGPSFYTTTAPSPSSPPPPPPPRTSRRRRRLDLRALLFLLVVIFTWTSLLGAAAQETAHGDRHLQRRSASLPSPRPLRSLRSLRSLPAVPVQDLAPACKGASLLVLDTRPPPAIPHLMPLQRRDDDATATKSASASKSSIDTEPSATPSNFAVPKPFDTALSNNFTASCAKFFQQFLNSESFTSCHPFSLMLQTSSAFFDASKSFIRITQTLEATCAADLATCRNTMADDARELVSDANCGTDYRNDNPQVLQAYNGLLAYEPLYQASCLRDDEGSYCYADAVTNTTATTDSYPYYLPLGVSLPGGTRPTCNSCLQDAMAIFSSFADNSTQPISQTYNGAAQQIQVACGPTFVNKTATPLKGAAPGTTVSLTPTISLFMILLLCFFQ